MRTDFLVAAAFVLAASTPPPQASKSPTVVHVEWQPIAEREGRQTAAPVFSSASDPELIRRAGEIVKVEEAFRFTKLTNDVASLRQLFADAFYETNQNGNSRDKQAAIDLWTDFRIRSLTTERADIRFSGNVAVVSGEQTEGNGTGTDRMLFTRIYQEAAGGWQLLSCTQFRHPRAGPGLDR